MLASVVLSLKLVWGRTELPPPVPDPVHQWTDADINEAIPEAGDIHGISTLPLIASIHNQ